LNGGIDPPELVTGTGIGPRWLSAFPLGVGPAAGAASADFDAGRVPTTATGFFRPSSKVISSPA
jgi:hypothetical protein